MNLVDLKYCGILSVRLDRFKVKSNNPYKANCRCPLCGDSQKSRTISRGWFIEKDNMAFYHCFNCGKSHRMWKFLQLVDMNLYNEYVIDTQLEKYGKKDTRSSPIETLVHRAPVFLKAGSPLSSIKKISQLAPGHPAKEYVIKRSIPPEEHYRLYYAPKFAKWVNSLIPDKLPEGTRDVPRLVLPFIDKDGKVFGFQGRAFDKQSIRYITIMLDEDRPKVFGLEKVDFNSQYYIVEGPIDSLFLPNCLAMAGADIRSSGLENVSNAVYIFDNEPRNKDIVNRMESAIDNGYRVCIWPNRIAEKDINDMILAGMSSENIVSVIDTYTYKGLAGKLEMAQWKKC